MCPWINGLGFYLSYQGHRAKHCSLWYTWLSLIFTFSHFKRSNSLSHIYCNYNKILVHVRLLTDNYVCAQMIIYEGRWGTVYTENLLVPKLYQALKTLQMQCFELTCCMGEGGHPHFLFFIYLITVFLNIFPNQCNIFLELKQEAYFIPFHSKFYTRRVEESEKPDLRQPPPHFISAYVYILHYPYLDGGWTRVVTHHCRRQVILLYLCIRGSWANNPNAREWSVPSRYFWLKIREPYIRDMI